MSTETLSTLEISNPGTGDPVASVPASTPEDVDRAVRAAHEAQRAWGRLGYADRGKVLHAMAEAFEAHVEELVPILVAEQGKTIREAKIELHKAADTVRVRRMPFRYSGDMCCSPSTSLPAARCARTSSSVRGASSSTVAVNVLSSRVTKN